MAKTYIHYGSAFDRKSFEKIKNVRTWTKPSGGFWASATNAKYGWSQWVRDNDAQDTFSLDKSFVFSLKESAKILKLETIEDLGNLPQRVDKTGLVFMRDVYYLNFEQLVEDGFDAIEVAIDNLYYPLYGWDCDSIVILNPDVIEF